MVRIVQLLEQVSLQLPQLVVVAVVLELLLHQSQVRQVVQVVVARQQAVRVMLRAEVFQVRHKVLLVV
jgi:hypothetical protein